LKPSLERGVAVLIEHNEQIGVFGGDIGDADVPFSVIERSLV
jgi:hypothetical protein